MVRMRVGSETSIDLYLPDRSGKYRDIYVPLSDIKLRADQLDPETVRTISNAFWASEDSSGDVSANGEVPINIVGEAS